MKDLDFIQVKQFVKLTNNDKKFGPVVLSDLRKWR